jgi:hypothetical protein
MADGCRNIVGPQQARGVDTVAMHVLRPLASQNVLWTFFRRHYKRFWLHFNQLLIAFVTGSKSVLLVIISNEPGWTIKVSPITTIALLTLYSANQVTLLALFTFLWKRHIGLKYDPTTIAD